MFNITLGQALDVWTQLERAYHGTNSYGGHEAEIYAYELQQCDPTAERGKGSSGDRAREEAARNASQSLYELLLRFFRNRGAVIHVDGNALGEWMVSGTPTTRWHITARPRS